MKCMLDSSSSGDEIDISTPSCGSVHSSSSVYSACTTSGLEAMPCSPTKKEFRKKSPVAAFFGWSMPFRLMPWMRCKVFRGIDGGAVGIEVVGCSYRRAEQLVNVHLATGLRKDILRGKRNNCEAMIQEAQRLVNYAPMNAIVDRKI